ncbi:restriction endonuclease subunit S [Pseudomonas viciae]|uniref:Restriction endonuclease subunit S n=1 Tax=Pseudomonas viciae TaxID=2505979 RepID=A0A4P7PMQ5_9PSED|nr:restriction endonuclease subunit S [Pseudomonas viciae]QBZ92046.1 restriction endonuclease subunit S [Pseudomonas viciae]
MSSKTKTTSALEEIKPALVPKLRFPGFDKPWSYDPLSKILKEHKIKNTAGRDVFSVSMEYGIVNQIELLGRSFAASDTSHYTIGRRFDVVYTKSPLKAFPFGIVKQCKFDGEVALSPLYGVFTPPNPYVGLMIEAYFEAPNRSKEFLSPLCQKGAKNTLQITNTTFLSGRLPLPMEQAEQQKIAECLSSMDELISAQGRKVEILKVHKKGLMQRLFPRGGESQPDFRFPEFQNTGEWEREELSNCLKKVIDYRGKAPPKSDSGVPLITAKNVRFGWLDMTNDEYIEESKYEEWMTRGIPQAGDILFTTEAPLGNVALFPCSGKFALGQRLLTLRSKTERCLPEFLFHSLLSPTMQEDIDFHSTGSTAKGIKSSVFVRLSFCYPKNIDEQQRIADCLTSLDDLIATQTQKLEALKAHKKGLMQQIFPAPVEVEV